MVNTIYKHLTEEEEADYRKFVDEDEEIRKFLKIVKLYHPVIRDEICKRLQGGAK